MTSILNNNNISLNSSGALARFVRSKSVGDVIQKVKPDYQELLDLPVSATMEEAFDLLLAEDILSIPIYDNEKNYVAIVSALDLLQLLSAKVCAMIVRKKIKLVTNFLGFLDK